MHLDLIEGVVVGVVESFATVGTIDKVVVTFDVTDVATNVVHVRDRFTSFCN